MSEKVEPALTPEEWIARGVFPVRIDHTGSLEVELSDWVYDEPGEDEYEVMIGRTLDVRQRHAIAALALHGQPFGFTRLHVASLRHIAEHARKDAANVGPQHALWDSIFAVEEAADRIEALLPPHPEDRNT